MSLAKEGFTQDIYSSLDESVFEGLHQEIINNVVLFHSYSYNSANSAIVTIVIIVLVQNCNQCQQFYQQHNLSICIEQQALFPELT